MVFATTAHAQPTDPPNIVLVIIDDLNNDIGYTGAAVHTPNIDRLAERGLMFTDAHCTSPVCNPSRTSLLLGQYPDKTGVLDNNTYFREVPGNADAVTLPQHFRENGYTTIAAGKIFHSGWRANKRHPAAKLADIEQSWDEYHEIEIGTPKAELGDRPWHRGRIQGWPANAFKWGPIDVDDDETNDFRNAAFIGKQLATLDEAGPTLLACGIYRPHLPFFAPRPYFDLYDPDGVPELPGYLEGDADDLPATGKKWANKARLQKPLVDLGLWGEAVQAYRASTSFADACVGKILDAYETSPERDNTYLVFISDHGFQLGEKGAWLKFSFWDRSTRVPMIIVGPGIEPGVRKQTVSLIDLYPTVVGLAELDAPEGLDGRDLGPLIEGTAGDWAGLARVFHESMDNEAIIDASFRYIRYVDGGEELYDRVADPHDWHNLANDPEYAEVLEKYRAMRHTARPE